MTAPLRALASAITTCLDAAKRALASANTADQQAKAASKSALDAQSGADTARVHSTNASNFEGAAATQAGIATTQAGVATTQAGIATTQAGVATTQATASQTSAAASQASRLASEAARDSVNTTGKVFADTASGIAGTTAGQTFAVLDASLQFWIIYKNNTGAAAEVARTYTKAYTDALIKPVASWGGGVAFTDPAGNKLMEVTPTKINHPDANAMRAGLAALPPTAIVSRWRGGLAVTDSAGNILMDVSPARINHPDINTLRAASSGAGVQRLLNGFFHCGDSRQAQESSIRNASNVVKNRLHWWHKANYQLGQSMVFVGANATSGFRSDQYLTQANLNQAIASIAKNLVIYGVANDIDAGFTAAQIWNGYNGAPGIKSAVAQAGAAGMRVILGLEAGANTFSSAKIGEVAKYRQLCYELKESTPNVELLDFARALWGNSTGTGAISFLPGAMQAEATVIHPGALGGSYIAPQMVTLAQRMGIAPAQRAPVAPWQVGANGGIQLIQNGFFTATNGGTAQGNVTGAVPSNWVLGTKNYNTNASPGGGQVTNIAYTPNANGTGSDIVLTLTAAAAGDGGYFYQPIQPAGVAGQYAAPIAGETYQGGVEIITAVGSSNFCGAWVEAGPHFSDTTFLQFVDGYVTTGHGAGPTTAYDDYLETDKFVLPAGKTIDYWSFYAAKWVFAGAGSAQITIRAPQLRKRFS